MGELLVHSLPRSCHHSCTSPSVHKSSHRHQLPRVDRRLTGAGLLAAASPTAPPNPHAGDASAPKQARELSPGTPQVALRPRQAGPGRRFAGIWPDRRRPVPKGPNCKALFLSKVLSANQGCMCESKICLGISVKFVS
jgi:hypothetical protein